MNKFSTDKATFYDIVINIHEIKLYFFTFYFS